MKGLRPSRREMMMDRTEVTSNPLRYGVRDVQRMPEPCTVVLFGASGDLAKRKLVPALYALWGRQLLPQGFSVVGFSRSAMSDDEYRAAMRRAVEEFGETIEVHEAEWESFAKGLFYNPGAAGDSAAFEKLTHLLEKLDAERGTGGNRLYYLSTPPSLYEPILDQISRFGLHTSEKGWRRVVLEKPFGRDLASARALNAKLALNFDEDRIFRVDHFLGKETVQNIMVFRFANGIFEPVWNHRYIDHIQITAAESAGIGTRAGYYEEAGALRDMIQNHVLQVMALVAMDPPVSLESDDVRDEKVRVMRAIRPIAHQEVNEVAVRGQYGPGFIGGREVPGYRQESGVNPESAVETYAAIRLVVDNWRWAGVNFYLRSGKRLPKRVAEVAIQFKRVPHLLFGSLAANRIEPNQLILRIQPDEGITLRFGAKMPDVKGGSGTRIRQVNMDFQYGAAFSVQSPEAYERLLHDAMLGDSTLFARRDMVENAWELLQPILDIWAGDRPDFHSYESGSWGPEAADHLIERDGYRWRRP